MTTWREDKRAENLRKHGVDLADADAFEWAVALDDDEEDRTEDYGEQRFRAVGPIGGEIYVYAYTLNEDGTDHAISLRKADKKERKHYAENV